MARPPLLLPAILLVAAFLVAFRLRLENANAAPPPLVDLGAACSLALLVLALVLAGSRLVACSKFMHQVGHRCDEGWE